MELDQAILDKLSAPERQKISRQLRQKQVDGYLRFIKEEKERGGGSIQKPYKPNKKRTKPNFAEDLLLQDAVENFDDKEVTKYLQQGSNFNFTTGNGTSLLHKCAAEDNAGTATILMSHGADVNIQDDDWWTPLHTACSCDSVDMVQLLLNNGADCSLVDVDGFFAVDHCQDGTETNQIMLRHMAAQGIDENHKKKIQMSRPRQMYQDVQEHLANGGSPNKINDNGVTLLHITCANGYKKVLRLLIKHGADLNIVDQNFWTPLHVAARFSQLDTVKILIKNKANLNVVDIEGNKPSAVAGSNEIKALLMKRERKAVRDSVTSELNVKDDDDDGEEEEESDGLQGGVIVRINSKTVKPRHSSVGKMDSIIEGQNYTKVIKNQGNAEQQTYEIVSGTRFEDQLLGEEGDIRSEEIIDENEEEIYVSKIWKTSDTTQVKLPSIGDTDNLKDLSDISEEAILTALQCRYQDNQVYTKIGDVLIAVNPFKDLPMYGKQVSTMYHSSPDLTSLPPHVYTSAEEAYRCMMRDQSPQCCVISGESGAGKSETCKLLVQYLSQVTGSEETNLNNKINQVAPLLEAFGNAQTLINDNSSRFAKYIDLTFNGEGNMVGARLTEYLLEKSRVVYQNEGERNFHVFYWMFCGLTPEESNVFHIKSPNAHRYVRSRVELTTAEIKDNKEKFWDLKKCLGYIGFTTDDIQNLLLTLAAVIHIGDITFCPQNNNDAAGIIDPVKVEEVSTMLDISPEELGSALVAEYTTTRGEQIKKERTVQQASDCRDALAKAIYSRLFSWIVNGINQLVESQYQSPEDAQIGILDIFGFENFKVNSFEQICINLANEQMQNFTNEHLFYKEQQDCMLEGIQLVDLNYKNNQEIIDTFMEKHTGVFAILDEESMFPKASDSSLAAKLHQGPGKKFPTVYKTPKDGGAVFTIVHYAGAVSYNLLGTLDKNRDTLPNAIIYTMKTSNSLLIKDLFQSKITRTGSLAPSARQQRSRRGTTKSPFEFFRRLRAGKTDRSKQPVAKAISASERKGPATMAYHFKCSLSELMTKVQTSTPHIIRCLKPNTTKSPMTFVGEYILAQLRYTGIVETIRIKKFGYSFRIKFHDLVNRFKPLVMCCLSSYSMVPDLEKCKEIFQYCLLGKKDGFKIGKTKVFMTDNIIAELEKANDQILKRIIISQSAVRRHLAVKIVEQKRKAVEAEVQTIGIPGKRRSDKERATSEIVHTFDDLDALIDNMYTDAISYQTYTGPLPDFPDNADMNGQVQYRGLPAPPMEAYIYEGDGMPPPCPREMYSQAGVYDEIPGEQNAGRRQKKPATPQRSPSTRLSTQSDDVFMDHPSSPRQQAPPHSQRQSAHHPSHNIAHQHQMLHQQPTSPKMKQKHMSHPDPSQSKPFSYFGLASPAQPKQRHSEGQVLHHQNQKRSPSDSNYEQVDANVYQNGQHRAGYGHEQMHPSHHGSQVYPPSSPVMQRQSQSSLTRTASMSPKMNRRNQSPKAAGTNIRSPGQRGPPSFPAPTAPGHHRSASPPLPPPPGAYDQPPPPPPIEKIPGHQSVSSFEIGKKKRQSSDTDVNRNQVYDPRFQQGHYPGQQVQYPGQYPPDSYFPQQGYGAGSPQQQQQLYQLQQQQYYQQQQYIQQQQQQQQHHHQSSQIPYSPPAPPSTGGLADQLNKVKLKPGKSGSTSNCEVVSNDELKAGQLAAELGKVKLKPAKTKDSASSSPEKCQESPVEFLSKLKPTGAKPWEKDTSPEQQQSVPQIPPDMDQFDEDYFPPPPPDLSELPPPEPANVVHTSPPNAKPNQSKGISAPGLSSKMADIEIDLSTIDYSQIPGYTPITAAVPNWKRDMIEKKNQEKLQEYVEYLKRQEMAQRRRKEEEEKWKNVPEWKRKILMEKAAQKADQDEAFDAAKKQKEKKKFESPDQVKLKPVKPKSESQQSPESPPKESIETKPLQEIKQNIPTSVSTKPDLMKASQPIVKQPEVKKAIHPSVTSLPIQPELRKTSQTIVSPGTDNLPPPPPPAVEEKPKRNIIVANSDPALLPPPPPDVMDDVDQEEERRRREEKRRQIEAEMDAEEDEGEIPQWKKEIMLKRGGVPKNWGDEREEINEAE